MKATEVIDNEAEHIALVGEPGTGKSVLAAKLATEGKNLLWFSLDAGHKIIRQLPREAQERINLIVLPDMKDYPIGVRTLSKVITGAEVFICHVHGYIDCPKCGGKINRESHERVCLNELDLDTVVVIDHGTRFSDSSTNHIFADENFNPPGNEAFDRWRKQGFLCQRFLGFIEKAPYNVVCIFHVYETIMEDDAKKLVPAMGTLNFSRTVSGYFDHVVYCELVNKSHRFGSSSTYSMRAQTKSRSNIEIEKMKVPSLAPFFAGQSNKIFRLEPVGTAPLQVVENKQNEEALRLLKGLKS